MSLLRISRYVMPSAALGGLNPLPDIGRKRNRGQIQVDDATIGKDEARYMGWAPVDSILPYQAQNGYNRIRHPRAWKSLVLENDHLQAVFLPELGGHLWSLIDKATGRELLHKNPVFQPCNLAIRNAWISGGVEWNIGVIGHSPYTVDHVFAERMQLDDGTPVLRLYQYERIRKLFFRIEAVLPNDSHCLFVRVRIDNPLPQETAVYWWSNIAVDERPDVRVLVPASRAYRYGYGGKLTKLAIPYMTLPGHDKETDISRTTTIGQAMDFFFDLPQDQRRWIAALDRDGYGLVQSSTDTLQGRKLFVWGSGAGGRNWQTFLSQPGSAYFEIQAGLAHTQLEHLPMPGRQVISWTELYGPLAVDPAMAQGKNWQVAIDAAEDQLQHVYPRAQTEAIHTRISEQLDGRSGELLHSGEGWALVDQKHYGDEFKNPGLQFPRRRLGAQEKIWLGLVEKNQLVCPDPLAPPQSHQVGPVWCDRLQHSIRSGSGQHWFGHYLHGVALSHGGHQDDAVAAFQKSLAMTENPWSLRCLAIHAQLRGDLKSAAEYYLKAVRISQERNLVIEAMSALQHHQQSSDVIALYEVMPDNLRQDGRIRVLLVEALLDLGKVDRAENMLRQPFHLNDIREGEIKLTDLWFRMCAQKHYPNQTRDESLMDIVRAAYPPPVHLDFRMR
ncbi:MAG: DUF5107 domain-containing protein [Eubacteriales bacterium]|nr:DUF5107 domain-containing protein [Eubacteriales bacterium]